MNEHAAPAPGAVPRAAPVTYASLGRRIDSLLRVFLEKKASDLHLSVGSPPVVRVDGDVERLRWRSLTEADFENLLQPITPPEVWERWKETGDGDFAYRLGDLARFRCNILRHELGSGAVFRLIPARVLSVEELGLPPQVAAVGKVARGLVLVTGPTGSGKSTTLAAMIDRVNRTRPCHIVTIEDPVEFVHRSNRAIVTHRELGPDTVSFAAALKAAVREDPDVVLVGELRDLETMSMALHAAETGLLVYGTLHTNSAPKTIDRLVDTFPGEEQEQVRTVLSEVLKAVVAQQLLKRIGGGRVAAFEVLRGSAALANAIREGKTSTITSLIQMGKSAGMVSMDQYLAELVVNELVRVEDAFEKAADKDSFQALVAKRRASRE